MTQELRLIVNADDFGITAGVNRGIIMAHERGIVTSASLMVGGAAVAGAVDYARAHSTLDVGLHVDLGEWEFRCGEWRPVYQIVDPGDERAVVAEVERQVELFFAYAGVPPTHLDSHQHVHTSGKARDAVVAAGARLGVPVRHFSEIRYCGSFYGQTAEGEALPYNITAEHLIAIINTLEPGITELACHPGLDHVLKATYCHERADEIDALCDIGVRQALVDRGVLLTRFSALRG